MNTQKRTKTSVDFNCTTALIYMVSQFLKKVLSSVSFKRQQVLHDILRLTNVNQQLQSAMQGILLTSIHIMHLSFPQSKSQSQLTELSHN